MFRKYLAITVLGLLIQLFGIGWGQSQSPCPDVFKYVKNEATGDIEGHIEIQRVQIGVVAHIEISLSIGAILPTKSVGVLELAISKEEAVEEIQQGRPLVYRVRFPIQRPVPLVTAIIFNNGKYCSGERAIAESGVTSVKLEHTLFPPGVVPQMQNPSNEDPTPFQYPNPSPYPSPGPDPYSGPYPSPNPSPRPIPALEPRPTSPPPSVTHRPFTQPSIAPVPTTEFNWNLVPKPTSNRADVSHIPQSNSLNYGTCGRPERSDVNLLISKGEKTKPGDWPWLVAIFVSRVKLEFQCGGSLLTDRHVLTAAHCLKTIGGQEIPASTLLAVAGRYKLRGWSERGSVTFEVSEFKLHAEYGHHGFNNDIAVMTLTETVTFGKLIMPICLWSGPQEIESVVGRTGFVVGWGRDELGNPVTEEPRLARVPIVSQEVCLRSSADFMRVTSNRTLCGGKLDGGGPCNGDSGSGLVVYDTRNRRYHIRGIVSLSLLDRATGACDLTQYVVFTDVAKYVDWIRQAIAN